jgi:ribosomal protein S18 acetylase RimI-like enzyme
MTENKYIKILNSNDLKNCFSFWDFENNSEKRNRIKYEIDTGIRVMYVYILDGIYVAGMSLQQLDNNTVYLSYLAVKKDFRNQGIGTEMIEYACQISKENSIFYITLNVDNDNSDAIRLYERLGFIEKRKNDYGRIEMIKEL